MPLSSSSAAAAAPAFDVLRARPLSAHDRLRPRPRCGGGRRSFSPVLAVAADAPSCLYVGPIESASKEMLEALYQQLRLYGSKSVVKYPRCSLRQQSTYADAEVNSCPLANCSIKRFEFPGRRGSKLKRQTTPKLSFVGEAMHREARRKPWTAGWRSCAVRSRSSRRRPAAAFPPLDQLLLWRKPYRIEVSFFSFWILGFVVSSPSLEKSLCAYSFLRFAALVSDSP
ncbi:hypothetical protein GW17_00043690 [Ensete ventricosum]|nr:hypothetical protein GW17_00043690 [Ensete ventricosum]